MVRAALAQRRNIGQGPVAGARLVPAASVMLASLLAALPIVSLSGWFPDARLWVEIDKVPALAEDRERLWRSVTAADFLTPEEKRAMLGLDR